MRVGHWANKLGVGGWVELSHPGEAERLWERPRPQGLPLSGWLDGWRPVVVGRL